MISTYLGCEMGLPPFFRKHPPIKPCHLEPEIRAKHIAANPIKVISKKWMARPIHDMKEPATFWNETETGIGPVCQHNHPETCCNWNQPAHTSQNRTRIDKHLLLQLVPKMCSTQSGQRTRQQSHEVKIAVRRCGLTYTIDSSKKYHITTK